MEKAWCVVEFDDGVQIVPQIWIKGDSCYWPTFKSSNSQRLYEKAVREYQNPNEKWSLHSARILESYELALPKLKRAEYESDLNTEDEEARKKSRSARKKVIPSSDVESEKDDSEFSSFPNVPQKMVMTHNEEQSENANGFVTPKTKVRSFLPMSCASTSTSTVVHRHSDGMSGGMVLQTAKDCCPCCCKFDKEYKRKTETNLREIKNQLKLVIQVLREQHRLQPVLNDNDDASSNDIEENLPITSTEKLEAWERKLASNEEQKKMVAFLAKGGGRDTNSVVKKILRKVLTDSVAVQFNWEGKKGKKMLSSLIISECIKKETAESPNVKSKSTTEQHIINSIKNWLKHATARLNNKNNKQNNSNKTQDENIDENQNEQDD